MTPAPSPRHQRIGRNLYRVLVVQPDLIYLDASRLQAVSTRGIEGPPTLIVEILSPATTLIDRSTKRQLYARQGVPYYWIVDPEARAGEAYVLSGYDLAVRATGSQPVSLPRSAGWP